MVEMMVLLAQAATRPAGGAAGEPKDDTEPKLGEGGGMGTQLAEAIPDTGVVWLDQGVNTLAVSVGDLLSTAIGALPAVLIGLIVLVLTALAVKLVDRAVRKVTSKARLRPSLRDLLRLFARIGVWFVGILVAAGIVFPGFGFAQLLATAGLASIAIGFAFQDIFENFFAGVLILWKFPIEIGDFVEVPAADDLVGSVEDIQIRMTLVRRVDGSLVVVPNSTLYKNPVRVLTNRASRRITVMCGIAYGEDVAEGRRVIREAVAGCETVRQDGGHPIQVFAQEFGDSSINFEVTWWTGATPKAIRESRDQVVEAVKRGLDEAGIEIPYPYRTLTFSKNEPDIIKAVAGRTGSGGGGGGEAEG
jgi:small-conductance mechanosensitive channel